MTKPEENVYGGYVPSGCTILDLACTDKIGAGYRPGTTINIVGDKHTGKTLLALSCLAMCAAYDLPHKLRYYNTENQIGFDVPALFGQKLADRIEHIQLEPPFCIEEWRDSMIDEARKDEPRVVVVDSLDALTSEDEVAQVDKEKEARRTGKQVSGNYGTAKAKINSQLMRRITGEWEKKGHILILISQTRQNIGGMFGGKTRSGGDALDFYAYHIMWLHHAGKIKRKISNNDVETGNETHVLLSKNKETGRQWKFSFNSYWDYGLDDVEAMIDFLLKWKCWEKDSNGKITPAGMEGLEAGKKGKIIEQVEGNGRVEELQNIVQSEWSKLKEKASPNRGRRRRFE